MFNATNNFDSRDSNNRPFIAWEPEKDFISTTFDPNKGGECVRVNILRLEEPKYSYSIGWKHPNGDFKVHFQAGQPLLPEVIALLAGQAKDYVDTAMKVINDAREKRNSDIERQRAQELERKAHKKKQHESNVERRKVENRQRAGRGGKQK